MQERRMGVCEGPHTGKAGAVTRAQAAEGKGKPLPTHKVPEEFVEDALLLGWMGKDHAVLRKSRQAWR
jgi:hypothetical protein